MWGFLGALIGGVIVLAGGFLTDRFRTRNEDRRWLADEKTKQRARTAERLRRLYAPLVQSTATIQGIAAEKDVLFASDGTEENRDARHRKELEIAYTLVTKIGGELLVDRDARPIRELYNAFRGTFNKYLVSLELLPVGTDRATKIEKLKQELSKLAMDIQVFAETQLDELSAPPSQKDLG